MKNRATLFKAYTAAYCKERNHHGIAQIIDIGFVVSAVGVALIGGDLPQLAAIALLWLAVREAPWFLRPDKYRRLAVRIQEQFDCSFGIPPNEVLTGERVPEHEILALADGSSAQLPETYFTDVRGLPAEIAAVVMQHQTATWAEVGHRRYSRLNYIISFAAVVVLLAWAYVSDRGTQSLVTQVIAPAAPFIVGRLQLGRRHNAQAAARADVRRRAERVLEAASADPASHPPPQFVRALQDRLYLERLNEGRIPQWLYALFAGKDRRTIDVSSNRQAQRVKRSPSHTPPSSAILN